MGMVGESFVRSTPLSQMTAGTENGFLATKITKGAKWGNVADWESRHLGGGRGATALPPCGRAVDETAVGERNDVG